MLLINKKTKKIVLGIILLTALWLSFFIINDQFNKNKQPSLLEIQKKYEEIAEKLFVVSGEFVCLPLKNENIPHNDLCVFGIKNDNDYYHLESISDDENNSINKIKKGQKIEIMGDLIFQESAIYKMKGVIKVKGIKYLYTEEKDLESTLPNSFTANFISFSNYDLGIFTTEEYPKLESWVENGEIECNPSPLESSLPLVVNKKNINNKKYCIIAVSEGGLGSVYTQYAYTTVINNNVYSARFIARYQNCNNYSEIDSGKCQEEREKFDLDILVDREIEKNSN